MAIGRHLGALSAAAHTTLTQAALFGREFATDAVARAGGWPIDAVLAHVDEAVTGRIVAAVPGRPGRYGFAHALFCETLIEALGEARGVALHRRAAQALAADPRGGHAAEIAHHWRFETPPGGQSQIDWGQARLYFRAHPVELHIFVLTLGFSRRGFYRACADERLAQFLDAHEAAFAHFGGHTREHLYDRPRTVCAPGRDDGKVIWNATFKAFAAYWGFEPRLCRPYRAQTKGKVESGVKYFRRNFLPGRSFIDQDDFQEQLDEWTTTIADVRIHGTTHERPIDRFARERDLLRPTRRSPELPARGPAEPDRRRRLPRRGRHQPLLGPLHA